MTSIQAEKLEDEVWRQVVAERAVVHPDAGTGPDRERVAGLQQQLETLEARAANVRRDYALDTIDAQTLKEALSVITSQADDIRRDLAEAARTEAASESRAAWLEARLPGPTDFDEVRQLVRAVVERIEVRKTDRNPRILAGARTTITWQPGRGLSPEFAASLSIAKAVRVRRDGPKGQQRP